MDFGTNKTPVEIIKEGAFGKTYFKDIYSGLNGKWYKKSRKEFKSKLIKMIKDVNDKFNDYSISPKIRFFYIGVMN